MQPAMMIVPAMKLKPKHDRDCIWGCSPLGRHPLVRPLTVLLVGYSSGLVLMNEIYDDMQAMLGDAWQPRDRK
ncbi:hypothetical protein [Mesorhizobium sp. M7A.F.Ca.MR.362.00.0.0]|uniref:hypothetical protein n=1 Tax=Mesorhizobium sp. M7A.F.Ca.MR.362.00.0.0 TaxID=2496779 RepID=UPI0013E353D8|nr:hypothetical protein [Mesorhizobium sp. M7A.F.Ca.MR.362.00.0.0]